MIQQMIDFPRSQRVRSLVSVGAMSIFIAFAEAQPSPQPPAAPDAPSPSTPAQPTPESSSKPPRSARPATSAEPFPELVVSTTDGTVLEGIRIAQDDVSITLEIAGIPARITRDRVNRVRELEPVLQRYKALRDATPISEVSKRVELVQWLLERRQIDLATSETQLLRAAHPTSRTVADLLPAIERRQKEIARTSAPGKSTPMGERRVSDALAEPPELDPDQPAPNPTPTPTPTPKSTIPTGPIAPADDEPAQAPISPASEREASRPFPPEAMGLVVPLLTDAQIALMKVYELDLTENPRVAFPRPVVRQMLEQYAASPIVPTDRLERDALLRQPPIKHVDLMFRLQAREFYDKVQVIDTPAPMRGFREDVHGIFIVNACSTNSCHGGLEAGRLVLSNYRPNADPTLWTNFYILSRFKNSAGQPLINWEEPQASPLLQYALPRDQSRLPHPRVMRDGQDQWRPAIQGPDDRRYAATIHWISSMYRPRPEYTIEYTPVRPFEPQPLRAKPIAPSVPR